jgi:copper transport protein
MSDPGPTRAAGATRGDRFRRLVRRLGLALLGFWVIVLIGPAPAAQAHAFLAGSNPADGVVLATAPTELRLQFSESVVLGATRIEIIDSSGRRLGTTRLTLVGAGSSTEDPVEVVAGLPALARGAYRVSWQTLSSDDLHATSGVLVFGIGATVTAGGLREPSPPPVEVGLRWVILLGLAGALGGPLAGRLLARAGLAAGLAQRITAWGAVVAAIAAGVLLVTQLVASGADAGELLRSSYGVRWGLRELGLLLLVGSAYARPVSARRPLLLAGAVLAGVGTALLGHSGSGSAPDVTRVLASAAHLIAAVTWAGCLTILAVVLLVPRRTDDGESLGRRASARGVLRLFGPPAAACVGVMVVTGIYLSSDVVGSVDAALFTSYGRTLLAKVALAGVAGALALVNTVAVRRRIVRAASDPRRTPRRTVIAEAVAAVGVLALAALLTSGQPAMEPQLVRSATSAASDVVDHTVGDLQEAVAIRPNRPGPNVLLLDVFNTRRPAVAPVRGVRVVLTSAAGVAGAPLVAEPIADGRWSVATDLAAGGALQVQVIVTRDGLADTVADFPWTVGGAEQTRAAVVSTAPIGSALRGVALVALLAVLAGWWFALRGRTRGRPEPETSAQAGETRPESADRPTVPSRAG